MGDAGTAIEKYCRKLLTESSKVSFDAACYITHLSRQYLKEFDGDLSVNQKCFCPKCAAPWIAGFFTSRLIPTLRSSKLKILLKRQKAGRLSGLDKKRLLAAKENQTLQIITCARCKYKLINSLDKPLKEKREQAFQDPVAKPIKKKKKKNRKEKTAGLNLENVNKTDSVCKIKLARMELNSKIVNKPGSRTDGLIPEIETVEKIPRKKKPLKVPFVFSKQSPIENKIIDKKKKKRTKTNIDWLQKALSINEDPRPSNLSSFLDSLLEV